MVVNDRHSVTNRYSADSRESSDFSRIKSRSSISKSIESSRRNRTERWDETIRKPIVLAFVGYYFPGYKSGGPVRTIANMVDRLGDQLDFRIVTADRDMLNIQPYPNVVIDGWNTVGKAKVFYASPRRRSVRSFAHLISETPHDILYLNSFFSQVFTMRPLLARVLGMIPNLPTVIAPRGEFSEGALALKWWKKHPYILCCKMLGLYRNLSWQASSSYEAEDIRKAMGFTAKQIIAAIVLAPDIAALSDFLTAEEPQKARVPGDPLRVCFLSRISPMKNLDYALQVLVAVKVPVEFDIYGVVDNKPYWQRCQELVKRLPVHVVVHYHGTIDHTNIAQALVKHDLFFLPTRGENYGHVIHEALASGLPVLISDQTPWRNLEALGVGWDLSLNDPERFSAVIEAQVEMNAEARAAQRRLTRQYAMRISKNEKVLSANLHLFMDLVAKEQAM